MTQARRKVTAAERRRTIAALYRSGLTQDEIAEQIGISQAAVSKHLKAARLDWHREAAELQGELIAAETMKLLKIEREAWEAWNRSKEAKTITSTERTRDDTVIGDASLPGLERVKASVRTEQSAGDPRYLQVLISVRDRVAKLFGLDAAQKLEITTPRGQRERPIEQLTDEELLAIVQAEDARAT